MFKKITGIALASVVAAYANATPFGYKDFSNAPSPYAPAEHETGDWQRLGMNYNLDDGVTWSTDGGHSFGHRDLTAGSNVTFKVDLFSHNIGGHISDPVRLWLDWNADGTWSDDEMIFSDKYKKSSTDRDYWIKGTPDDPTPNGANPWNSRQWTNGNAGDWVKLEYAFSVLVPTSASIGDTWLRARATCDASLGGSDWQRTWSDWAWDAKEGDINLMTPTGWLHQGEVEDYKIRINKQVASVPEPSGLLLCLLLLPLLIRRRAARNP
jgi:hypothetical protein